MYLRPVSLLGQRLLKLTDVPRSRRSDVGVQTCGGKAFVFAELRQNLGAQRNVRLRIFFLNDFPDSLLVSRIQKGKQEAHRNRLHPVLLHLTHRLTDFLFVQRNELRAVRRDYALRDAVAVVSSADRIFLPRNILYDGKIRRTLVTRDMNDIPVTFGGDHSGSRALVFQNHVGRNRRAVEYLIDFLMSDVQFLTDGIDALHHADGRILRRRRGLIDFDSALVAYIDKIRKRAADVHSHSFHVRSSLIYRKKVQTPASLFRY